MQVLRATSLRWCLLQNSSCSKEAAVLFQHTFLILPETAASHAKVTTIFTRCSTDFFFCLCFIQFTLLLTRKHVLRLAMMRFAHVSSAGVAIRL